MNNQSVQLNTIQGFENINEGILLPSKIIYVH
jgi:hypothetical protein